MQRAASALHYTPEQVAAEQASFLRKVYAVMSTGLAITGGTAFAIAQSKAALKTILTPMVFYGLLFVELIMVWSFSAIARRVSAVAAGGLFFAYALVNGLTLSVVFLLYTRESIALTFFVTAGTFAAMSAYGALTKKSLDGLGHFAIMGLFGLILASIVNLFLASSVLTWITTCAGVLIFTALTAYDTQKIKELNVLGNEGTDEDRKEAISGALILYLDFVNLFLYLLRLFGSRRD